MLLHAIAHSIKQQFYFLKTVVFFPRRPAVTRIPFAEFKVTLITNSVQFLAMRLSKLYAKRPMFVGNSN